MRTQLVVAACLSALCLEPVQSVEAPYRLGTSFGPTPHTQQAAEIQFRKAREALAGERKDTEQAKRLLLEIVKDGGGALNSNSLCYAYVYLGYIDDRAGNREEAIAWYTKALTIQDADLGILEVARVGLKMPITWIRHLDQVQSPQRSANPSNAPVKTPKIGNGYVTKSDPPVGLIPAKALSAEERRRNFDFLWEAIDETYACFKLKSINWPEVRRRYRERLDSVATSDDFYLLLFQLVNELRDTHSWLQNYRPPVLPNGPGLSVELFEGRPLVVAVTPDSEAAGAGVKGGSEILAVDGLTIEEKMERLRPYLPARSSERAYKREACRYLLTGEKGSTATVKLGSPDGRTETLTLKRNFRLGNRPPVRTFTFDLTRQHFVHFGRHPSGVGYIWIESFNGREEIADEFDRALETLKDTPGLILDIRDNQGGFGQPRIVGRFLKGRTLVSISYIKSGPGHSDVRRNENYLGPSGRWQYTRPVALLVNGVTGSASDLFACWMRSAGRVVTIGSTTHGNLSGVAAYAVLPCGLVVRISNGYISDAKNRPIEGNGNEPDIVVSPSISDFLTGRDPVLERAVALVGERSQHNSKLPK